MLIEIEVKGTGKLGDGDSFAALIDIAGTPSMETQHPSQPQKICDSVDGTANNN